MKGNEYIEDLKSGDALAVMAWSGDILGANAEAVEGGAKENPYAFVIPPRGGLLWSDNMVVPIGSPHKKNAEILMNYYYDPAVAAQVADYVEYICPVRGAQQFLKKDDPEVAANRLVFPTEADLARVKVFRAMAAQEENTVSTKFQSVLGA